MVRARVRVGARMSRFNGAGAYGQLEGLIAGNRIAWNDSSYILVLLRCSSSKSFGIIYLP